MQKSKLELIAHLMATIHMIAEKLKTDYSIYRTDEKLHIKVGTPLHSNKYEVDLGHYDLPAHITSICSEINEIS